MNDSTIISRRRRPCAACVRFASTFFATLLVPLSLTAEPVDGQPSGSAQDSTISEVVVQPDPTATVTAPALDESSAGEARVLPGPGRRVPVAPEQVPDQTKANRSGHLSPALDAGIPTESQDENQDIAALRQRAQERWEALITGDYDKVYAFASPSYRAAFPKSHLLGRYANQVKRTGVEVQNAKLSHDDPDVATVGVNIDYVTELWGGGLYKGTRYFETSWIKEDDQWWHVER